jgi:hypothetical protein
VQELLGRIARLDPSASLGLRVIACFDELMVGMFLLNLIFGVFPLRISVPRWHSSDVIH